MTKAYYSGHGDAAECPRKINETPLVLQVTAIPGVLAYYTKDRRTVGVHRRWPGSDPARRKGLTGPAIRQNAQSSRPGKPGRLTGNPVIEKGTSTTSWSPSSLRKEERSAEGRRYLVAAGLYFYSNHTKVQHHPRA